MAYIPNPPMVVEPYEESQGPESPTETSPEELKAFYEDMERREILERKLSKRTSTWSRKSVKRSTTAPPVQRNPKEPPRNSSKVDLHEKDAEAGVAQMDDYLDDTGPHLSTSRSVIVDARDNAAWGENGTWSTVPLPTFKVRYNLHNPLGPRWYRNHHLIPPSQKRPSMRPPTFFSPSFPPMHTFSMPEHMDDSQDLSRTPSHSPLPTPSSSQTRVMDGGKPRSRKTSQTTPDIVDLLDLTDPWGTNWHHQSPYDIGQTTTVADNSEIPNRARRASMTATQTRHQSVAPSPLSQSTSAVHLHPTQQEIHIPQKLTKRRTPTVGTIFPSQPNEPELKATSTPTTPMDKICISSAPDTAPSNPTSLPKRMSVAPPPVQPLTSKKEKRGSMLNRLAKKFSMLRKPAEGAGSVSDWWHINSQEVKGYPNGQTSNFDQGGSSSPEKPHLESVKRIPPPSIEPQAVPPPVESTQDADRVSLSSLETPYSMGRLTIANPDILDSDKEILETGKAPPPPVKTTDLPPSHPDIQLHLPLSIQMPLEPPPAISASPASPTEVRSRLDKPLPPPQIPTPQFSQLGLPDLNTPLSSAPSLPPLPSQESSPERTYAHLLSPQTHILHEAPKRVPSQLRAIPPSPQNEFVTDAVLSERTQSSPIDIPVVQETPTRSPSQLKSTTELSKGPTSPPEKVVIDPPTSAELPSVQIQAQETPKKPQAHVQESTSRNVVVPPDTTPTSKNHAHERTSSRRTPSSPQTREQPAEGSSSKGYSTRQTRSHSRPESIPAPAPAPVPFPSTHHEKPNRDRLASYEAYEASPISTSSMLANPPTPYDHRLSLALSSEHTPPTLPPKSIYENKTSHNVTPTDPSPRRQTETFKLVRSSSGNVYASSQTITAAGQQWEVVESVEIMGRKEKSTPRTRDQEHRPRDQEPKLRSRDQEQKYRESEHRASEHRAKDSEYRSKDYDYRSKEYDRSSRDYERRSKDYDRRTKEYEPRTREYESRSKEYESRPKEYESRSKEYESRSKEYDSKPRDHERRSRNYDPRDHEQRHKEHDYTHKSKESERRSKDYDHRSKDFERDSRREYKNASKSKLDVDNMDYRQSSHRSSKQSIQQAESTKGRSNGKGGSRHHEERSRHEEASKSSRNRDEHRERRSERRTTDTHSSSHHHSSQPHPVPILPPNPPPAPARLERNPSLTARPTSELPSAADMNAMRAKESWEMERLWKARSMYGLEPNAPTTNFIPGPGSTSSRSDDAPTQSAVYGSGHTAYMVQPPFQSGRGTQIYHSMPTGPPPIIYSSPASIPSIPDSISSYERYEPVYRPYPPTTVDYRSPPSMARPSLNNPLPEPPRESIYDPPTLTSTRGGKRQSNDYWTNYNGITTAH